jgi:hypothetical protein
MRFIIGAIGSVVMVQQYDRFQISDWLVQSNVAMGEFWNGTAIHRRVTESNEHIISLGT